ncbi:glycerate kinase [Lacihabitans sp. LS3-19]|uniref:glycerate kinase n=1 Tax=Lacihabitans sp. LS3-19 TaxID=2487335 RepID=UPI0020CD6EB0|nr:glycerate kinase [Lacihabitans sp. LS3-19]MCP9770036.1 glycerate kinase [Lacihabitans sp. LS3-19]
MQILIAPDSFKDSLSARKVAESIAEGISQTFSQAQIEILPLADGGEGTLEAIKSTQKEVKIMASDPLFRKLPTEYLWDEKTKTAFIEMAKISGLECLKPEERNPDKTSTFGTGELVLDALKQKAKKIILFIGGSATNDGGIGLAAALGYFFYDKDGNTLNPIGESLIEIASYSYSGAIDLSQTEFIVATDVTNPFYGENGAAYIYAKQKGASEDQIRMLDSGLKNLSEIVSKTQNIDVQTIPGAGAAGGLGGGAVAFLNAKVISAADLVFEICDLQEKIQKADIIITGEGRIDEQTWNGKLIARLLETAKNKKVILIGGSVETNIENKPNVIKVYQIKKPKMSLEYAKAIAADLLFETGKEIGLFFKD